EDGIRDDLVTGVKTCALPIFGGRRRPRSDRGDGAEEPRARRRQALDPARMTVAAWICLLFPLAGALAITLAGTRISRRAAGYVRSEERRVGNRWRSLGVGGLV